MDAFEHIQDENTDELEEYREIADNIAQALDT